MYAFLTILHILVCIFLILVVLLQSGKGQDLASAFGGGASQTVFGSAGAASALSKATSFAAILFMVTSLGLAISSTQTDSVMDDAPIPEQVESPAEVDGPELPAEEPGQTGPELPAEAPEQAGPGAPAEQSGPQPEVSGPSAADESADEEDPFAGPPGPPGPPGSSDAP